MKSVIKIWKAKGQILEGIKNNIFKNDDIEDIASERQKICDACPSKGDKCVMPGSGPCCVECGCSLKFKLRSLSSNCPLNKWKAELTFDEEYVLQKKLRENKI
jgi:hypothetical protein